MVRIKSIEVMMFGYESESKEKLDEIFKKLVGEKFEIQKSIGFYNDIILIYKANIYEEDNIKEFLNKLKKYIDEESKNIILEEFFDRLDEFLRLHLKFDKQIFYQKEKLVLTNESDAIKVIINFYSEKGSVEENVKDIFNYIKNMFKLERI